MIKIVRMCDSCKLPNAVDHALICLACTELLRKLLVSVPDALGELDTSLTRQTRIGAGSGGRRGSERPLPYDVAASEAADVLLAQTVTRWALDVWRGTESPLKTNPPDSPVDYLLGRLDVIRFRGYAAAMLDEVQLALDNAWATVDIAADYLEAGLCDCGTRLVARPDQPLVECRSCARSYDVLSRRAEMVRSAENRLLQAKEVERLVDVFLRIGENDRIRKRIPAGSVRGWASKGDIEIQGFAADGRSPVYRVGDVFDRAFRELAKVAA